MRSAIVLLAAGILVFYAAVGGTAESYGPGIQSCPLSQGWNLLALPAVAVPADPPTVFAGLPLQGTLRRWNAASQSTIYYDPSYPAIFGNVLYSEGYWLNAVAGATLAFTGIADTNDMDVYVSLPYAGQTVVGNPWKKQVDWASVKVTNGYATVTLADAAAAGWLRSSASAWDESTQTYAPLAPGAALLPWRACEVTSNVPKLGLIFEHEPQPPAPQYPATNTCYYAKLRPDSSYVSLPGKVIAAVLPGKNCMYVQEPDRSSGIRVDGTWSGYDVGDRVDITGVVTTRKPSGSIPSERQISAATLTLAARGNGDGPEPLMSTCKVIGGAAVLPYLPGVQSGVGLNNMGLLMRVCGRVTNKTTQYVWVDDGSNLADDWGVPTVMVECPSLAPAEVQVGDLVAAAGVVSGYIANGATASRRYLVSRDWRDVTFYRAAGGAGVITGRVTDVSGSAIADAAVVVGSARYSAFTDADGRYRIEGVCAGTYAAESGRSGFVPAVRDRVEVRSGESVTVDFTMTKSAAAITGRVWSSTGAVVAGATVSANTGGLAVKTDTSGRYTLTDVSPGSYTVSVSKTDYVTQTQSDVRVPDGQIVNLDFVGFAPAGSQPRPEVYRVTQPADGSNAASNRYVEVAWEGDPHDARQVRVVDTANGSSVVYDSGGVSGSGFSLARVGPLPCEADLDITVRLRNASGWGPWSAPIRYLTRVRIIPAPQLVIRTSGSAFQVASASRIIVPPAPTDEDMFAANQLHAKLYACAGVSAPVVRYSPGMSLQGAIALGQRTSDGSYDNPAVMQLVSTWPEADGRAPRDEGSMVGIRGDGIVVAGYDSDGTFYGCQSVIQLLEQMQGRPIPGMFIYDYPDLRMRGVLLRVWSWWGGYDPAFAEEVVSEVVARYKMNVIEPEIRLGMRYDTAPYLRYDPTAISKSEMAQFCAMMKRYHINVIAAGVSPTHADQWITNTPEYAGLAFTSGGPDLDISKPATQAFLGGLLDEQIEVCQPEIVHVGGDEGGVDMNPLTYLSTIRWLHDYVAARGLRAAIWGDMAEHYSLASTIRAAMPGMTVQDWDYTSSKIEFPSLLGWTSAGLKSWACPYGVYVNNGVPGPYNIYYSAVSASQYGSEGLVAFNKAQLGAKSEILNSSYALSNFSMYPYYAEWGWHVGEPPGSPLTRPALPFDGQDIFLRQIGPDRPSDTAATYGETGVVVEWTSPVSPNCAGVRVCYRHDRYPESIEDGITLYDVGVGPGVHGSCVDPADGAANVYYSVFARDDLMHFSAPSHAVVRMDAQWVKGQPDGASVDFWGIVSAVFGDCVYVENPNRASGIRVDATGPLPPVGSAVSVSGRVQTSSEGERYVVAGSELVRVTGREDATAY